MRIRVRTAIRLSALVGALAAPASAQLISIRTVPIAQGDQFDIFPSHNYGMGGVSIALADTLLDPFVNPAKAARVGTARFFGSPAVYSVSEGSGGGRTLPLGAFWGRGSWYGGLALALQEVDASRRDPFFPFPLVRDIAPQPQPTPALGPEERSHGNTFAFAAVGKSLPQRGLSIAGSALWAGLSAVEGVDMLYAGSERVRQSGHAVDLRLGVLKEWAGDRSLEAIIVHNRYRMAHAVSYLDWFWDPAQQQPMQRVRVDHNLDRTNIWGLHLEYERPLASSGWRIGWLATGNRMSHPKIPNYEIMSIPRDPGHSSAFNIGIGLSRTSGRATFGIDVMYEPIWSNTWADAAGPIETRLGDTIPAGGKTIENDFRFSNALFRMGFSHDLEMAGRERGAGLQLGLIVRSVHYWLDQYDNVQIAGRSQEERWVEWTPTWGLVLRFPELEVRYRGRVTHGTGRPGVDTGTFLATPDRATLGSGIIAAPSGPLTLDEVNVVTHQISLTLPLW